MDRRDRSLFEQILHSFDRFFKTEVAGGVVLILASLLAMILANSPAGESYFKFWTEHIRFQLFGKEGSISLLHLINDGLMAIFFLSVGLEIKHEVAVGRLSSMRSATMPLLGALGGMLLPALIYLGFNWGSPYSKAWAIPMATDIAFTLGILALLGKAVPSSLRIFVAALAIADDLGAVLVIAFVYTEQLNLVALLVAFACIALLLLLNNRHVTGLTPYVLTGIVLWFATYASGVHATLAGVILGLTIPAAPRWSSSKFLDALGRGYRDMEELIAPNDTEDTEEARQGIVYSIEQAAERVQSPLLRFSAAIHPVVAFLIVPLFALANAGLALSVSAELFQGSVFLGVSTGLLVGKTLGIVSFIWLGQKLGLTALPDKVRWIQLLGVATLCGIGFTMSLFITDLSLGGNAQQVEAAKLAIVMASLLAGIIGFATLKKSSSSH